MNKLKLNFTKYNNIIKTYHNEFYKNEKEKQLVDSVTNRYVSQLKASCMYYYKTYDIKSDKKLEYLIDKYTDQLINQYDITLTNPNNKNKYRFEELIGYQYEDINDYLRHKKFINNKREI